MRVGNVISDVLLLALAVAFMVHIGFVWSYGTMFIHEPNMYILALETLGFAAIIGYSFWRLVSHVRKI